ncbi:MAG: hypothetical protein MJA84_07055 [Firmicutes bacterium]|nr:hypothetical protein [Bacillota bacterium]
MYRVKKTLGVLLAPVFLILLWAPVAGGAEPGSPEVRKAVAGAVKYLDRELSAPGYDGTLEWAMLGFYGVGADLQHLSDAREAQIARGIMISEAKSTDYQRSVIGALAAGKNPDGYGGKNLLQGVISSQMPGGKFADSIDGTGVRLINAHIWGIISIYASGRDIPNADKALRWLEWHQNPDGGFGIDTRVAHSDVDMTAMALIAIACLGKDGSYPAAARALDYLKEQQYEDGTFGVWGVSTAESCAQVIQALVILGIDPASDQWSKGGSNPVTGLLQFRLADGSFTHGAGGPANNMATAQALIALGDYHAGASVYQRIRQSGEPSIGEGASQTQPKLYNSLINLILSHQ